MPEGAILLSRLPRGAELGVPRGATLLTRLPRGALLCAPQGTSSSPPPSPVRWGAWRSRAAAFGSLRVRAAAFGSLRARAAAVGSPRVREAAVWFAKCPRSRRSLRRWFAGGPIAFWLNRSRGVVVRLRCGHIQSKKRKRGAASNSAWAALPAGPSRQEERGAVLHGPDETSRPVPLFATPPSAVSSSTP